jgi:uncharacterized membrane protein YccC
MQTAMQSMMQQQGSGGMMSYQQFMQQMQSMANAQQQINQGTMQLGGGDPMSLAQGAAMSRLAQRQQQVRKSMQQLAKEAGDAQEVLGSLDKIGEDMKKVEEDLANQQISRETLERQNRILSRMLDAQRSIREREYSRQRQAETGSPVMAKTPGALPDDLGERRNQLEQDLIRARREGFSQDYLEMIETYFEGLTNDAP